MYSTVINAYEIQKDVLRRFDSSLSIGFMDIDEERLKQAQAQACQEGPIMGMSGTGMSRGVKYGHVKHMSITSRVVMHVPRVNRIQPGHVKHRSSTSRGVLQVKHGKRVLYVISM